MRFCLPPVAIWTAAPSPPTPLPHAGEGLGERAGASYSDKFNREATAATRA